MGGDQPRLEQVCRRLMIMSLATGSARQAASAI
jgi:hypothetical protein